MNIMLKSILTNNVQTFMFYSVYGFHFFFCKQKKNYVSYIKINFLFKLSFLFLWVVYFLNNQINWLFIFKSNSIKTPHMFKGYNIVTTYLNAFYIASFRVIKLTANIMLVITIIIYLFFTIICFIF